MEGVPQSAPELGVVGRGHSGCWGGWGSVICSLSPVVECLLNTQEPELFWEMGWLGWGGEGQEDVPCVASRQRARLPKGSTWKGGCDGFGMRLELEFRVGVACRHCSGPQGLPRPSRSPPDLPVAMRLLCRSWCAGRLGL